MKNVALFLFLLLTHLGKPLLAATEPVPAFIQQRFQKEYPGAKYPQWELLEETTIYSVRFLHNQQSIVAYFDEAGNAVARLSLLTIADLPDCVRKAVLNRYAETTIKKTEQLLMDGASSYFIYIDTGTNQICLSVSSNGCIKQVTERLKTKT